MGLGHSPRIVTDGLVLALDAGNTKSYPGSGTTWTDISGNGNTGTLTGGPTYSSDNGGSIDFNGGYAEISSNADFLFGTEEFAMEWWEYFTGSIGQHGRIGVFQYNDTIPNIWTLDGIFKCYRQGFGFTNIAMSPISNQWAHYVVTGVTGNIRFYQNGELKDTTDWDWSTSSSAINFAVGGAPGWAFVGNYAMPGKISAVRVYKGRSLSTAEVEQNYNALKGRYGI